MPDWVLKLARRLLSLQPGRYQIILTINDRPDWTVVSLGKIENS